MRCCCWFSTSLQRSIPTILRSCDVIKDDVIEEGVAEEVDRIELRAEPQRPEVVDSRAQERAGVTTRKLWHKLPEMRQTVDVCVLP